MDKIYVSILNHFHSDYLLISHIGIGNYDRHYLVISKEHIPTVKDLQKRQDDYTLVSHMLDVGKSLLRRDAPQSKQYRFGFHQPPLNSVNHLHLHCLALPYTPSWRCIKYTSLGPLGGFIEAEKLLQRLKL
nr:bifunctional adenosine 5'-phosphosulfate phosphorylase/adenylylsulfatase HINT4 [Ipomoea batatas]